MIAEIIIDISNDGVDRIFDYTADGAISVGSRVVVPFLNRKMQGYVINVKEKSDYEGRLKAVEAVLDDGIISREMLSLMDYMTARYNLRRIDVLHLFLPPNMRDGKVGELKRKFVTLNPEMKYDEIIASVRKSQSRQIELIDALESGGDYLSNLTALYGSTVNTLIKKGLLTVSARPVRRVPALGAIESGGVELTADQRYCVGEIMSAIGRKAAEQSEAVNAKTNAEQCGIAKDTTQYGIAESAEQSEAVNAKTNAKQCGITKDITQYGIAESAEQSEAVNAKTDSNRCDNKNTEITAVQNKPENTKTKQDHTTAENAEQRGGRFLLHGVTGSGKTEVYMRVIEDTVKQGKTAVMLVPEISLTAQFYKLFKGRFFDDVAIIHSGLSAGERFDEWMRILNKEASIVIGARSAIFAPLENIGVIIIDEEHDGSYMSESNPRYDAKEVAAFRAEKNSAALVLGSATPSVDTYYKMTKGGYQLLSMPNRVNAKCLPKIEIVDMCAELRNGNAGLFSRRTEDALAATLKAGNQAMIYLNRRGYSSFVMCRACGYVAKCSDCDISLTYHSGDDLLKCHYCGKKFYMIDECPECKSKNLRYGKTGTEKVVQELKKLFPKARILRMDNDTTREKDGHDKILSAFYRKEADILVGTQMIAKGHDFSDVTLVGILDADMSLYFSDYRSNERTFQLMTQVAGRAGREKKSGEVILQTYAPSHYVFKIAARYDYKAFYEKEINSREVTKYPPFTVIVRVLVTGDADEPAMKTVRKIYNAIKEFSRSGEAESGSFVYLAAMRSPVARIQNRFRYQILMRIKNDGNADRIISEIYRLSDGGHEKDTVVFTEINPQSLT
ncbi:MAG: primosomal protein N' [Clostridiales bacterium]|nr:primosomal protein N' [Clostridiales bacterium]